MYNATSRADQLTPTLANLVDGQSVGAIGQFGEGLEGLNEELTGLMDPAVSTRVADFFGTLAMNGGDERRQRVLAEIKAIDESLVKMAQEQGLPAAQDAFD